MHPVGSLRLVLHIADAGQLITKQRFSVQDHIHYLLTAFESRLLKPGSGANSAISRYSKVQAPRATSHAIQRLAVLLPPPPKY